MYGNKSHKIQLGGNQQQAHNLMQSNMLLGGGQNFNSASMIQQGKRQHDLLNRQMAFRNAQ